MCLAIPAKIIQIMDSHRAMVTVGGIEREISLALVDNVVEGDYVVIHVGYALTRLDQDDAEKTLQLFATLE